MLYQPQIDIATGALLGVEALVRWQHPEDGLIMPGRFIGVAEQIGLMDLIGDWVTTAACKQMDQWQVHGFFVPRISINFSAQQFHRSNVPSMLRRLLSRFRLDANRVMVELTESALAKNVENFQSIFRELKAIGVQISIDDFGTGYSSLAYLTRFAPNELKIDRSFITSIAENMDDRSIAQTILAMAKALGLTVVAEGIETEAQLEVLRALDCRIGQGYLFDKPLSAVQLLQRYFKLG